MDPIGLVLTTMLALVLGLMAMYYMASRPKHAFVFFILVLCVVPFWVQAPTSISIPPATLAIFIIAPALLRARPRDSTGMVDVMLVVVSLLSLIAAGLGLSPRYAASALVIQWATAFLVGRRLGFAVGRRFVTDTMAVAGTVVAVWAILEYVTKVHVYENVATTANLGFWAEIQIRGGLARSEAGFGHAIALGGFLAATIPFILSSRFRLRMLMTTVVIGGVLTTLSRGPMLSAILAVVLVVAFTSKGITVGTRFWVMVTGGITAVFVIPPILAKFATISDELDPSTAYRENLWTDIPGDLKIIGQARNVGIDSQGRSLWRSLGSIDSTPLLIGLDFGWIILGIFTACVAVAVWRVLTQHGSVAEIAFVAQIPTLATVALITQYAAAVWLLAGLAVAFRGTPDESTGFDDIAHREKQSRVALATRMT